MWGLVGSLGARDGGLQRRTEALAARGQQAAAATAGGVGQLGSRAAGPGAQAQQEQQARQQQAESETVQPPLNLKVAC